MTTAGVEAVGDVAREADARHPSDRPLVDISVGSRFHAFDLARELHGAGMLRHLHTGYPAFAAPRFGVPRQHVRSVWTGEPLNRSIDLLCRRGLIARRDEFLSRRHDRIVASRLRPGAEIFVGWSGQSRKSLSVARSLGMVTVLERGSAHISWQRHALIEEARRTGLRVEVPDPRTEEQELAEYDAADYIAVPSVFSWRTFVEQRVPAAKLLINPYGVDLRRFSAGPVQASAQPSGGLRVIQVGRVSAQKGVHYLIEAVRAVPGARLVLVGDIDPAMTAIAADAPQVRLAGPVPGPELPQWYRQADVCCLLSVHDGFGMVIAQAMAMGLPVVASANTGAAEMIEDGVQGFIVPARDPAAAAARLQQLADSTGLRQAMGRRARERISDGFDWSDYGARARAHYACIARVHRSGK